MTCRCPSKAASEPRLTEERSKAEIFSALRRSDETQVLLPAPKFVPYGTSEMHFVRESLASEPEIRLRRMKERISFHILRSKIFHNARERIISHSASPNISLKRKLHFCTMTKREHVGST